MARSPFNNGPDRDARRAEGHEQPASWRGRLHRGRKRRSQQTGATLEKCQGVVKGHGSFADGGQLEITVECGKVERP